MLDKEQILRQQERVVTELEGYKAGYTQALQWVLAQQPVESKANEESSAPKS